ncbi:MAG: glycosyltransferase family 4 protein [Gammaproteobacteria bacterium]|nr:MAG: glycosyltransferase family 4 protein [Gammaproteobacteria bacterium]
MKLLLLADPNSPHTIKWASSLCLFDIDIIIFTLCDLHVDDYDKIDNIKIITSNMQIGTTEGAWNKLKYLRVLPVLKKTIKTFKPDIVHAHYASSYGLLGSLANFSPFILSIWGSDVYSFPKKSFLHQKILQYNLIKADKILSTSNVMKKEIGIYTNKNVEVTPFGIDLQKFKPTKVKSLFKGNDIVIGTVKTLDKKYGIDYLIKAFKIVCNKQQNLPLKLLIVGGGPQDQKTELEKLVADLEIKNKVIFTDNVPFKMVSTYHNMLSIFVALSTEIESFGVAIIEASACQKPVVVSNVGGLPEVVDDKKTGFVVEAKNEYAAAEKIEKLVLDKKLRDKMGEEGRKRVKKLYNWDDNVRQMLRIYQEVCIE